MITTDYLTEHQVMLMNQEELVNEVEEVTGKFCEMELVYSLQTTEEILCSLAKRMETLNKHLAEYKLISSQIDSAQMEEIRRMTASLENYVGIVERDKYGNLHCGNCLVSYRFCRNMVGKKVRISLISLNTNNITRNLYPTFAKHIDEVE